MRGAIYIRVSKDEILGSERFQDPSNQIEPIQKYCEAMRIDIIARYIDRASGADATRSGFRSMMGDALQRKFDVIIVWKLDRFSREPLFVLMGYIQKLRMAGIGLISVTESWLDTRQENPMSDLVLAVLAWAAAEERRKISERTKIGIQRKKELGIYQGGRPRGKKDTKPRRKSGYYVHHMRKKEGYNLDPPFAT